MSMHVVVCGAGVIGAAVAYELTKRGVSVTVIESDGVASGASGAAAGLLTPPLPGSGVLEEIQQAGFDQHAALAAVLPAESGVAYGYERVPRVLLATTEEEEEALRALAARLRSTGRTGRWLDAADLPSLTGWVDRGARGGLVVQESAQLDPYRFTLALLAAAERRGAETRSGRVRGLPAEDGRVTGVTVGDDRVGADAVVVALGPWSAVAGGWLGLPVPVEPLKGQILKVRPPQDLRPLCLGHGGDYAVTKPGGIVYVGTTEEQAGFDRSPTTAARDQILSFGTRFASVLEAATLVEQTACLRPLSGDGLPIIGAVPGLAGAFVATGHGRQGILQAPPTGRAVADLILDGRTDCMDLAPFEPGRFARASH